MHLSWTPGVDKGSRGGMGHKYHITGMSFVQRLGARLGDEENICFIYQS